MMCQSNRYVVASVICCVTWAFAACGPDDPEPDAGEDAGADTMTTADADAMTGDTSGGGDDAVDTGDEADTREDDTGGEGDTGGHNDVGTVDPCSGDDDCDGRYVCAQSRCVSPVCRDQGSDQTVSTDFMTDCNPDASDACPDAMSCITFQSGDSGNESIARCLPTCDPGPGPESDATCGGKMHGRFAYLGTQLNAVDVYVDGERQVDDLGSGSVSDAGGSPFFTFEAGEHRIEVVDGAEDDASDPLAQDSVTVTSGRVRTWTIAPNANGVLKLRSVEVPRGVCQPAQGNASLRAVLHVPDFEDGTGSGVSADIVAVPAGGSPDEGGVELLNDADLGAAGDFVQVPSGSYDIYAFQNGAPRNEGNALAVLSGIEVGQEAFGSLYLEGTADQPRSVLVPYASAPKAPSLSCWDRGESGASTGICLQGCEFSDYGTDSCFRDGNGCGPVGSDGDHFCAPSGDNQVGESCDPTQFRSCGEGATCRAYGDGSSVCHGQCVGGDASNPALTCGQSRSCTADDGEFGRCDPACSPGSSYADESCPEHLQTCFPESASNGQTSDAYCSPSDGRTEGESCGGSDRDLTLQNCEAGMFCAYDTATQDNPFVGQFVHRDGAEATCKQPCDPFADNPGCPDGQACGVDLAYTASNAVGVCMDQADGLSNKSTTTRCTESNVGKLCGDHSHCVTTQGQHLCYEFCHWGSKEGCTDPAQECQPFQDGPIGGLGICAPSN